MKDVLNNLNQNYEYLHTKVNCNKSATEAISIAFLIPAYDFNHQGLLIDLTLNATPSSQLQVHASGSIAESLKRSFTRVLEIMSSLKSSWVCLQGYEYTLFSFNEHYKVKDARSADLPLCIVALNVVRNHNQMQSVDDYIGTGTLRMDGSFNKTFLEEIKEKASQISHSSQRRFINSTQCDHVFELDALLNK